MIPGAVMRLRLRQTAGFGRSLMQIMMLDLAVPDHTTLARRRRTVDVREQRWKRKGPIDIVIDSTGMKFFGAGEWARAKHGDSRRSWRKLCIFLSIQRATRSLSMNRRMTTQPRLPWPAFRRELRRQYRPRDRRRGL